MKITNYKQKAIEYSIGVIIGFFILFYLFNNLLTKVKIETNNIQNHINFTNTALLKHDDSLKMLRNNVEILNMNQEYMIEKLFQLDSSINKLNKQVQRNNYLIYDKIKNNK
jgi:predicted  nucleic acid-binding Zn-ribbon protein